MRPKDPGLAGVEILRDLSGAFALWIRWVDLTLRPSG